MSDGPEVSRRPQRPSFLTSAAQTYGTNLLVAVLSLVNVLIVARALGAAGRGDIAFLTAIAFITSNLATMGVQEANANLAGSEPRLRGALATNSVLLSLLFGGVAIVIVAGLIALFPVVGGESSSGLRWLTLGSIPFHVLAILLRFLAQADYGFGMTNLAWLIGPVANVVVNGGLALLGVLSVATALATWIAGQVAGVLLLVWYVQRRLAGFGRPNRELAGRTLTFGLKSHIGRVMLLGNYRLDQWILGSIAGSRELGIYSVAVAWTEALFLLPTALSYVQRPDLVRTAGREAARLTAAAFRAAALLTAAIGLVMIAAAPLLCVMVFGEDFRGAVDDLRVLVLGAFGVIALKQLGSALTAQRLPLHASAAIGVGFVATVVLDFVLIPPLGGLGAALASTLAYTGAGIVIGVIFVRALGGRLTDFWPRPADLTVMWSAMRSFVRGRRTAPEEASR